ncbi:hypothetical protein, partial [Aureimonas sp. Leaf460]|uniref:hypothetical protein n=2 Tax=unclassified Aureimonas TaxID=2615206 RepID=UPI001AEC0EFD
NGPPQPDLEAAGANLLALCDVPGGRLLSGHHLIAYFARHPLAQQPLLRPVRRAVGRVLSRLRNQN